MKRRCRCLGAGIVLLLGSLQAYGSCRDLVRAYPDHLKGCKENRLIWKDGETMLYDDGRQNKSFDQLLNRPDLEDMFHYRYDRNFNGGLRKARQKNYDPGRIRYEPFFRKMYGNTASQVQRHLTTIDWFGQKVRVTKINGVASQLLAVERELKRYPELRKYLVPIGGTFNWRHIAGTRRLSVHSFGAAIDINTKYSAYWRWSKSGRRPLNRIPRKIVETFEKHGFIWGGKWYHYDTMHFEYRPEILGMHGNSGHVIRSTTPMQKTSVFRHRSAKSGHPMTSSWEKVYIVRPGDTLYGIAKRHGTSVDKLKKTNNLKDNNIHPNQMLTIPR